MQYLLTSTSRQLYAITSGRGRLASVTVALPSSWAGTACAANASSGAASTFLSKSGEDEFDVAVTSPHPVFGSRQPWAAQTGGCGDVGRGLRMPFTTLTDLQDRAERNYAGERKQENNCRQF